jgi:hypothetical protein
MTDMLYASRAVHSCNKNFCDRNSNCEPFTAHFECKNASRGAARAGGCGQEKYENSTAYGSKLAQMNGHCTGSYSIQRNTQLHP